ncbi:GNAT family N-acetyltransferase [Flaviaesturariibacter amylovorans]|uniref:GNAT family N-acetyltransferase n=1 Tax=Flaviaesturariibacter amylovorans TaxID=1084520 RepID=A0ABP8GEK6_9BACT
MTIEHVQNAQDGTFFVPGNNEHLAEMTYRRHDPKTLVIDHTEVSDALKGKNVGLQLVQSAVEYARTEGLKIVPVCSFARAMFDKKPELRDVLQTEPE